MKKNEASTLIKKMTKTKTKKQLGRSTALLRHRLLRRLEGLCPSSQCRCSATRTRMRSSLFETMARQRRRSLRSFKQEFTELTGRDATKTNVLKELKDLDIAFTSEHKATQTAWWKEVLEAIWKHVRAREAKKSNYKVTALLESDVELSTEVVCYVRATFDLMNEKLGVPTKEGWLLRFCDTEATLPVLSEGQSDASASSEVNIIRSCSYPWASLWRVYGENQSSFDRLAEIFGEENVFAQFPDRLWLASLNLV